MDQAHNCTRVWSHAFALDTDNDSFQVAELLRKLSRELQATESALEAMEVPPHLYKNAVNALRPMLAASNLSQHWSVVVGATAAHHVMAFRWAAYILPDEVNQVDTEDLNELKQLLADFEAVLADATLPPHLLAYLSDQLATMKAAIAAVTVSGATDIKAAVRKAVADAHFNEDDLKAEASVVEPEKVKEVKSRFSRLFKKGAEVAGDLDKLGKGAKLLYDAGEWLGLQWDKISSL